MSIGIGVGVPALLRQPRTGPASGNGLLQEGGVGNFILLESGDELILEG